MTFKENLLEKIKIDRLTKKVLGSIGPPDSGSRVDKEAMIKLLEMGSYKELKERDLDLYILEGDTDHGRLLVLDNDLAIYNTSAQDVGLRKSPTVKEMVSIRNIKKILNDSDVVISKKEASVQTIQTACIDMLDLSWNVADIEQMANEGAEALERGNMEGARESLMLFSDLLGYQSAPKPFKLEHHEIMGCLSRGDNSELIIFPVVIYTPFENHLRLMNTQIGSFDKKNIEIMHKVANGVENDVLEGADVFQYLKEAVVQAKN